MIRTGLAGTDLLRLREVLQDTPRNAVLQLAPLLRVALSVSSGHAMNAAGHQAVVGECCQGPTKQARHKAPEEGADLRHGTWDQKKPANAASKRDDPAAFCAGTPSAAVIVLTTVIV
jgi:hypothetical protein